MQGESNDDMACTRRFKRDLVSRAGIAVLDCPGLVDDLVPGLVDGLDLMDEIVVRAWVAERDGFVALAWAEATAAFVAQAWWRALVGCWAVADRRVCCLDLGAGPAAWLEGGSRFPEDGYFREDGY